MAYQADIQGQTTRDGADRPVTEFSAARLNGHRPLLQWSLACRNALFLVTRQLKLVDYNPAAEALLEPRGDMQLVSGHLAFAEKVRTSTFQAFFDGLDGEPRGWAYRRSCGAFIVMRADPIPAAEPDVEGDLIALTIYPTDPAERYVWADFAPHFDLTRSEAAVVRRLVGGQPASVVAEELGVSIETVRTHIRRIYNKLEINSREQLFAVAAPFRLG